MSESVTLPALGESVTEGTVTRWLKKVGDRVEVDEPLLEVSTDKVDTEIPSPVAGVIEEILVPGDETVEVGTPLVKIGDGSGVGRPPADSAPEAEAAATGPASTHDPPRTSSRPSRRRPPRRRPTRRRHRPTRRPPQAAQPARSSPHDDAPSRGVDQLPRARALPRPGPAAAPTTPPTPAQPAPAAAPLLLAAGPPRPLLAPRQQPALRLRRAAAPRRGALRHAARAQARQRAGRRPASITGTGVGGRIRKEDVLDAAEAAAGGARCRRAAAPPPRVRPSRPRCAARRCRCRACARSSPSAPSCRCSRRPSSPAWSRSTSPRSRTSATR